MSQASHREGGPHLVQLEEGKNLSSDPQRPAKANNATIHFSVGDTKGIISNKQEAAPVCELFSLMMSFNHLGPKIYQRVSVTPCLLGEKPR